MQPLVHRRPRASVHALLALVAVAGCGGSYRARTPAAAATPAAEASDAPPPDVLASALPFAIVDGRTGRAVATEDFWARLRAARAVCAGETHPSPHDHWAQLQILEQVSRGAAPGQLGLGLEMVQRPFQGVLDDWSAGAIDEAALLSRTGWSDRWGFPFALYRPMLEQARERKLGLVALNAPRDLVKRVARVGVDGLDPDERAQLPALDLADAQHKAWFERLMASMDDDGGAHGHGGGHGHGGAAAPSLANIYASQVVWDESMADGAARWLVAGGERRLVILAGNGHCHDGAIVRRLVRRGPQPVLSVRPIVDDGQGNVAAALAEGMVDFLFVMTPP